MKIRNLEVYGVIYKITNTINGKIYIGQTCQKRGFKDRYGAKGIESVYKLQFRRKETKRFYNRHILRSVEKYGFGAFSVCEVFDIAFSKDELNIKEQCWISIYKSDNKKLGYNQCEGGNATKGYKYTEEQKQNVSKGKKGKTIGTENSFFGKHHTEEQRKEWSKQRSGRKLSKEWIDNKIKAQQKKVINLDTGLIFNSIKEASFHYGLHDTNISRVCKGKNKVCGGYRWEYYNDDNYMSIPSQA